MHDFVVFPVDTRNKLFQFVISHFTRFIKSFIY